MKQKDEAQQDSFLQSEAVPNTEAFLTAEARVQQFKNLFAQESPYVRERLVQDLESYNVLLSLEATSFRTLALQDIARDRGIDFDSENPPLPSCPHCGSISTRPKKDKTKEEGLYYCRDCKKTFTANYGSISSGSKEDLLTYTKLLHCMLRYETVAKTCRYCNITPTTFYRMKLRIYRAIQVLLEPLRLYGHIQADETYVHISFKGSNSLKESDFPDDDDRFIQNYNLREKRERGGSYSQKERNRNSLCIFAAVDDHGHVMTCYSGIGIPGFKALKKHIPSEKFMNSVPDADPFPFTKKRRTEPETKPGDKSLFICDGEKALEKYASETLSMKPYSRVFRRNGKQAKVPKKYKHLNIQRVNYIHRRLEEHLARSYGSSRYIKGSLLLFDFMMCTGAPENQEAIDELLRILARPNLCQDDDSYENNFTVPNHLIEWLELDGASALKKLPYERIYAYFLYDKYKHPEEYPGASIPTFPEIQSMTGLSAPIIYRTYWDYSEAGYRQMIIKHFWKQPKANAKNAKKRREKTDLGYRISEADLALYDRYADILNRSACDRISLQAVCDEINEEYHTAYTPGKARYRFSIIERYSKNSGLRRPLADVKKLNSIVNSYVVPSTAFRVLDDYDAIIDRCLKEGQPVLKKSRIIDALAEKHQSLTRLVIEEYIYLAKSFCSQNPGMRKSIAERIYDAFCVFRTSNKYDKELETSFLKQIRDQYNLSSSDSQIMHNLFWFAKYDGKPPLPQYINSDKTHEVATSDGQFKTLSIYLKLAQEYLDAGFAVPTDAIMIKKIQEISQLDPKEIRRYLRLTRSYRMMFIRKNEAPAFTESNEES